MGLILDEKTKKGIKLIEKTVEGVGEKKITTVLTLMKNGKISDADLMKVLGLGTSNSAAYYRKELEKEGIIKGYYAEIDWGKLGYGIPFTIIVNAESPEALLGLEELQSLFMKNYSKSFGDVCVIPTKRGGVILRDISFCFGSCAIAIIKGHATSEQDVVVFSKYYLLDIYPGIKTTIVLIKDNIIKNFIIDREIIDLVNYEKGTGKSQKISRSDESEKLKNEIEAQEKPDNKIDASKQQEKKQEKDTLLANIEKFFE